MRHNPCSLSFASDRGERHTNSRDNVDGGELLPHTGGCSIQTGVVGGEATCPEEVTKLNPEGQAGGGCTHRMRPGKPMMTVTETKIIIHHHILSTCLVLCQKLYLVFLSHTYTHVRTRTHTHTYTDSNNFSECVFYSALSLLCDKQVD